MNENKKSIRLALVANLLEMREPLDGIVKKLASIEWDYDGNSIELKSRHLIEILKRYIEGSISDIDVETWANLIEGRDDIFINAGSRATIMDVMHELANPYLTQSLNRTRAMQLLSTLEVAEQ